MNHGGEPPYDGNTVGLRGGREPEAAQSRDRTPGAKKIEKERRWRRDAKWVQIRRVSDGETQVGEKRRVISRVVGRLGRTCTKRE